MAIYSPYNNSAKLLSALFAMNPKNGEKPGISERLGGGKGEPWVPPNYCNDITYSNGFNRRIN